MDPSGIIGIIGVVAHILTTCTKLGLSWRDAPEDAKKFKSELDGLHKALLETYNYLIQDPDFISAFAGKHSAVLSHLAQQSNPDDAALLSACQEELDNVLKGLKKQLGGSRFGWGRFKGMLSSERTQSAIENLQRRCQVINSMITIDNTTLAVNTNLEVRSTRKYLEEKHLGEEKTKILDWITSIDFKAQQSDNLERRQEGTGQWLLESPKFQAWVKKDHKTLLCPGMPGAGKTMLASIVIEHLQDRFGHNPAVGIAYIFCNFRRQDEQKPRDLLASILKQLYQAMPEGADEHEVGKAYRSHACGSTPMSTKEIIACLRSVTSCYTKMYVLVDALDECRGDEGYRDTFLTALLALSKTANVNCFATSRHIPEIENHFDTSTSIEIRATDEDVMKFLCGHMSKLPLAVKKNRELQNEVQTSIVRAVQGMFLLAQLHLDSLQGKRSAKAVRAAVHKLSSGSSAYNIAYDEAMERIEGQLNDQETLAKDALSWIVCARRPLRILELQHALAVEPGATKLDEDNLPELEDIVSVCAGLVTVDKESGVVRLVHYTAQEYFERTSKRWLPNAQQLIAELCTTYLSFDCFSFKAYMPFDITENSPYVYGMAARWDSRREENPLYEYAALEWGHHAQTTSPPSEWLIAFLMGSQAKLDAAYEFIWSKIWFLNGCDSPEKLSGLHLAAYFGLQEAFTTILERSETEVNINVCDSSGFTPLMYAVMGVKSDFIAWLLKKDEVNVNWTTTDPLVFTPMDLAFLMGNVSNIRLLMHNSKTDLGHRNPVGRTPLWHAAKYGFPEIVKALIETGKVDVNSLDAWGHTPLLAAAKSGHTDVVRFLLGTGKVNPNAVDHGGRTPLHLAVDKAMEGTVQYLLDSGTVDASLVIKDKLNRSPLQISRKTFGSDHPITRLFVQRMEAVGARTT